MVVVAQDTGAISIVATVLLLTGRYNPQSLPEPFHSVAAGCARACSKRV